MVRFSNGDVKEEIAREDVERAEREAVWIYLSRNEWAKQQATRRAEDATDACACAGGTAAGIDV